MSTSPFPWSEGESFVLDANGDLICREPHYFDGKNWRDDRALIAAIPEMVAALTQVLKDDREFRCCSSATLEHIETVLKKVRQS